MEKEGPKVFGPFRKDARFLTESHGSVLFSYDTDPPSVLKQTKLPQNMEDMTAKQAMTDIEHIRRLRHELAEAIQEKGGSAEMLPETTYIIHDNENGEKPVVDISRWQIYIEDARPLASLTAREFLSLPEATRDNLHHLFAATLELDPSFSPDLIGAHPPDRRLSFGNILRKPFTVLNSENIVIDKGGVPKYIDIDDTGKWQSPGPFGIIKRANRWRVQLSLGMLNAVDTARKIGAFFK